MNNNDVFIDLWASSHSSRPNRRNHRPPRWTPSMDRWRHCRPGERRFRPGSTRPSRPQQHNSCPTWRRWPTAAREAKTRALSKVTYHHLSKSDHRPRLFQQKMVANRSEEKSRKIKGSLGIHHNPRSNQVSQHVTRCLSIDVTKNWLDGTHSTLNKNL